jgi:NAD(P)-dependent dehydrogenase (short-subunit alcohol dehydrogenase family)
VNVSSAAAVLPEATAELEIIAYAVSKAGLETLTQSLAHELRSQHIAVNSLRIEGSVATEGWTLAHPEGDYSGWEKPEVIAEAIVRLATRAPAFTGRVLEVADVRTAMRLTD